MTHIWSPSGAQLRCDMPDCTASFGRPPKCQIVGEELRELAEQYGWRRGLGRDWCDVHVMWRSARLEAV